MFHKRIFQLIFFVFTATFIFAAKPMPSESAFVRIEYIIDSFDNEEVDTIMPRVVLDAILQDVDSVYLAPYGSCYCDCAGGDLFFIFLKKVKRN